MWHFLTKRKERKIAARTLAEEAIAAARNPLFYREYGVPDTFDGRFELAVLHLFILLQGAPALSQPAFDAFFKKMDVTLREIGVGDLGVPKHMKRMMNGFNGRLRRYYEGIKDPEALRAALRRNVYGTLEAPDEGNIEALTAYVLNRLEKKEVRDGTGK